MHEHRRTRVTRPGERGASLIEYALLIALIAVVVFSAVTFFGQSSAGGFGKAQSCMTSAYAGNSIPANCK
jgi:Flp pilus assembly pilin Flp